VIDRSEQGADQAPPADGSLPGTAPDRSSELAGRRRDIPLSGQFEAGAAPSSSAAAWTWLLFFVLGFVGGQIVAELLAVISASIAGDSTSLAAIAKLSEPPTWYIVSTLFGLWMGFFAAAWASSWARGTHRLARDMGLRFRWIDLIGVPIGVGGQFLVALMYIPISQHVNHFNQRFDAPSQRLTGSSHGSGYVVIALCTVVGAPFFEELFFRGVLLRALVRLFGAVGGWIGPTLAVVVCGVVFSLFHFEALQFAGLAVFGVILSFVSYRTGRLGMNMVAHATFNLTALTAVILPLAVGTRVVL
jgi:membrane protease YdiL (CAAX protease family)